jgi:hypothetical protein
MNTNTNTKKDVWAAEKNEQHIETSYFDMVAVRPGFGLSDLNQAGIVGMDSEPADEPINIWG